jgi:hypothetical protein
VATYKEISDSDIQTTKSFLNQLVDVIQEDISGSVTRKTYQVFVTGGVGPGVTSSLFQTVYDQDFSLQTANPVFDMTVGIFSGSTDVASCSTGIDSVGKVLFPSNSLMMREKVSNYRQFAQILLGNANSQFSSPFVDPATTDNIDHAMFICFKRLFARDSIKRETFAMKFYTSASATQRDGANFHPGHSNLFVTSESGSQIFTDVGAASSKLTAFGGPVGNIVNSANTTNRVGLMFYDQGIGVFDLAKVLSGSQHMSGTIAAMNVNNPYSIGYGKTILGASNVGNSSNTDAKFIPDFMTSGSIDDIVNHLASCRFSSGSNTAMTFQNLTGINSTLIFCRATADQFNYSSNPTYVNTSDNRIRVIQVGHEASQKAFSFITTVGLYDANDNLLAVAKLSRPIEKNDEKDITIRVRLDF